MKKVVFVIVSMLVLSSPTFAANLFPLQTGNSWTYRDAASGDTFTIQVGTPVITDGRVYYSLRGYTPSRLFVRMDEETNRLMAWDELHEQEIPLVSFRPDGFWWQAPFRGCESDGQTLPTPGEHNGPAGFFETVLELRYGSVGCANGIEWEQFAQNYGLLRRIVASTLGPRQFDLISANIGGMTIGISAPFHLPMSGSVTRTTASR